MVRTRFEFTLLSAHPPHTRGRRHGAISFRLSQSLHPPTQHHFLPFPFFITTVVVVVVVVVVVCCAAAAATVVVVHPLVEVVMALALTPVVTRYLYL